jgi:hypothetical protein
MSAWTWTATVNRRPEVVFAYLTDMSRHGEWSPRPYSIEPAVQKDLDSFKARCEAST